MLVHTAHGPEVSAADGSPPVRSERYRDQPWRGLGGYFVHFASFGVFGVLTVAALSALGAPWIVVTLVAAFFIASAAGMAWLLSSMWEMADHIDSLHDLYGQLIGDGDAKLSSTLDADEECSP